MYKAINVLKCVKGDYKNILMAGYQNKGHYFQQKNTLHVSLDKALMMLN
jgi:hypothetical protein